MSSDSNRPNPEWWKKPAPQVNDDTDPFADAGAQETRAVPLGNAGYPQAGQGYPAETQAYPPG